MGSHTGVIRGRTKLDVRNHYFELAEDDAWDWSPPPHKKACKREMKWDEAHKEWVLKYVAYK